MNLVVIQILDVLVDFIQVITIAFAMLDIMGVELEDQVDVSYVPTELIGTLGIHVSIALTSITKLE
jgi:hypothetical protein